MDYYAIYKRLRSEFPELKKYKLEEAYDSPAMEEVIFRFKKGFYIMAEHRVVCYDYSRKFNDTFSTVDSIWFYPMVNMKVEGVDESPKKIDISKWDK